MNDIHQYLENYIYENIPVISSMKITISSVASKSIEVKADIQANINHRNTAFGGSISTLGIVSGWLLIKYWFLKKGITSTIVIRESKTDFKKPILEDFYAKVIHLDEE